MNKQYSILKLAFLMLIAFAFSAYHSGSPGGRTGSPTDVNTCGVSGCHGTQTPVQADLIEAGIPLTGYEGDSSYTITINASKAGINKYGFELVAEDTAGNAVGSFTGNTEVTSFLSNRRATHKASSNTGTDGRTWTVTWTAPAEGTGPVHFYCASLFANGNGNNTGDSVRIDDLEIQENRLVGINELAELHIGISPNPASNYIIINGADDKFENIELINNHGQIVLESEFTEELDISSLEIGNYYLKLSSEAYSKTYKFIKQ